MRTLSAKIIAIQLFFLTVALMSIGVTLLVSWELEGGAAAINDAGSLRMRAYRLAFLLAQPTAPDTAASTRQELQADVREFESVLALLRQGDPVRPLFLPKDARIESLFHEVESHWLPLKAAALARADGAEGAEARIGKGQVANFVGSINELVSLVEHSISNTTNLLHLFQLGLVGLAIAGTIALIYLAFLVIIGPVQRLREGMQRMADGDFGVRLPADSPDEFGQLARGFNTMANRLRDLYQNLEQRVASKTQSLAERNNELSALYAIGAFLSEPRPLDAMCQGFMERVAKEFGADAAAVRFIGSTPAQVHLFASSHLPESFIQEEQCIPVGTCACGEAALGDIPIHVERLQSDITPLKACHKHDFRSVSAVPIRAQSEPLGVLNLFFKAPRAMSDREQTLLASLGQQLGVAVENQRLVSREKEMAVSEERNLLAQELHDSIAQSLAFLNLQVQMLGTAMKRDDRAAAQGATHEIEAGVRECYADVRELLLHFRTRSSDPDISHALRLTLKKFEQQTGMRASFTESGEAMPVPAEAQVQVLHIIQEALSNTRKHAGADAVDVRIERGPVYTFSVHDNGRGFDTDEANHPGESELHVGLRIMRERARRAGADLRVESEVGKGTSVILSLPVSSMAQPVREPA